jgi:hypothetical protein
MERQRDKNTFGQGGREIETYGQRKGWKDRQTVREGQ